MNEWQRKKRRQPALFWLDTGLYSKGMHDFILMEAELGHRAASAQDSEDAGWSALMDLSYEMYCREHDTPR